jgi:hypothetical protein
VGIVEIFISVPAEPQAAFPVRIANLLKVHSQAGARLDFPASFPRVVPALIIFGRD